MIRNQGEGWIDIFTKRITYSTPIAISSIDKLQKISHVHLNQALMRFDTDRSFNSISLVNSEMSTNDLIYILANRAAPNGFIIDEEKSKEVFKRELTDFATDLAKLVVRDGEGMTRFVTITVKKQV